MDAIELTLFIRELLCSGKDNEILQHDLIELLGPTSLEFVTMLLQRRVRYNFSFLTFFFLSFF